VVNNERIWINRTRYYREEKCGWIKQNDFNVIVIVDFFFIFVGCGSGGGGGGDDTNFVKKIENSLHK